MNRTIHQKGGLATKLFTKEEPLFFFFFGTHSQIVNKCILTLNFFTSLFLTKKINQTHVLYLIINQF